MVTLTLFNANFDFLLKNNFTFFTCFNEFNIPLHVHYYVTIRPTGNQDQHWIIGLSYDVIHGTFCIQSIAFKSFICYVCIKW